MVVEAFEIRKEVYDTMIFDSPKSPYKSRTMISYMLSDEKPSPGKESKYFCFIPNFPKFPDIIYNEKVKIPKDAAVERIPFEVFKRLFESCGGTVEEKIIV
ncbi:MAG: hypothetical protein V1678_02755 [Candidatus Aenigmatarchaeota archaeon]